MRTWYAARSTPARVAFWIVGVTLALAALWIGLHFIPLHIEESRAATSKQSRQEEGADAIHHAYVLWSQGKPRRAKDVLKEAFGERRWARIPVNNPWSQPWVHVSAGRDCREAGWIVSADADYIDVTLFRAKFTQEFCWRSGKVTSVGPLNAVGEVTGFGEFLNWSSQGAISGSSHWGQDHTSHLSVAKVRFHQCVPIPVGCIFGHDYDMTGRMRLHGNGAADFTSK